MGELPLVKAWSPEYMQDVTVVWRAKQASYRARGVAPSYGVMRTQPAAAGRFIDAEDVRLQRRVVFLGQRGGAEAVRQPRPPVGETVRLNGMAFEVDRRAAARRCSSRTTAGPTRKACSFRTRRPASCGTPST